MTTPKTTGSNSILVNVIMTLIGALAVVIWQDVKDIKSDVKTVLAQYNEIDKRVTMLEAHAGKPTSGPVQEPQPPYFLTTVFLPKDEDQFKTIFN